MTFCEELRQVSAGIWAREHEHPFVRGIGDGTLPADKFRFFLEQDYLYLIDFARTFAFATIRAPDVATMTAFSRLCAETLGTEMEMHRELCGAFGIGPEALERVEPARTTRGYAGHLLSVAATGTLADIIAVVLPCQWGYNELGRSLAARGLPEQPHYRQWIEMYTSADFEALGAWLRERMEVEAARLGPQERERLKRHFHLSSRWEYLFWEMAWHMETWNVPEDA